MAVNLNYREISVGLVEATEGEHDGSLAAFIGIVKDNGEKVAIPIPEKQLPDLIGALQIALKQIQDRRQQLNQA